VPGAANEATAVEVTGAIGFGPSRGLHWLTPIREPFTDPRLAGEFRTWADNMAYPGGPTFWVGSFSMHDEDGAWVQRLNVGVTTPAAATRRG